MPIKSHVKGKRKAPPPPNANALASTSNAKSTTIIQSEHTFPNGNVGKMPETMTNFTIQKRKKPAPQPPIAESANKENHSHTMCNEMNNLSAISKKLTNKSPVKAINLNIFEPNHIRNDFHCSAKETNEVNVNLDTHRRHDIFNNNFREYRHDQVWICNYCTLQNPFWKIICDACERIKPYSTPNVSNVNTPFVKTVDNQMAPRINEKNFMSTVMMRPKTIKPNNDVDKILNRKSMNVDIKSASSSKQLPNKRNSLCLFKHGDQNITPEVLEMEKERIRTLIRAMNNRALAQKYPIKFEQRIDEVKNDVAARTATINKPGKRRNGLLKYDIEKDYNLPSVRQTLGECSTAKQLNTNTNALESIEKIEKTDNRMKCNTIVEIIETNCDEESLANKRKNFSNKHQNPNTTATKNCIKSDGNEHEILLNLYVNFNNAIEVRIRRDMTLNEFKIYIFRMMPCKNAKIYFNGLLLRNGEQTLANYGITNQSSLYVNSENVAVQALAKNEKKSVIVQTEEPETLKIGASNIKNGTKAAESETKSAKSETKGAKSEVSEVKIDAKEVKSEGILFQKEEKIEKHKGDEATLKPLLDEAIDKKVDGEKFLIEHIQLNRYTIERIAPRNENIIKVKYRGVCNYNPRCNPEITKMLNNKPVNPIKKPVFNSIVNITEESSNSIADKLKSISQLQKSEPVTQYIELLSLDDSMDLTKNTEVFECSVCMVDYQPLEGLILRNCLHTFCKDCTRSTIIYSDEAEVKCPYFDDQYSCDCLLQDREIKAVLSKTEYDEHLAKSLRIAEHQIENSFHCKTPDCKGWCIYEDDVNTFKCPICRLENCLTCRVIHDGLNCKQYQNMMENNLGNNPENATTHAMLDEMIKNGEAMNCPACKIVLMKKWGCDWLKCSMCKTEICWITRGYRWGPGGKGDTSAGCRCGVDGFRCHPKCNYCH